MEAFWSGLNITASALIVIVFLRYRHLVVEQSIVERMSYNAMAIFCACICIKALYNFSYNEFASDKYGILFRTAYCFYLFSNLYAAGHDGVSVLFRRDKATHYHVYRTPSSVKTKLEHHQML